MATYRVTLEDGRTVDVHSSDPAYVKKQANHEETSRMVIASLRGVPDPVEPSIAVSYEKIKD
jgi:hypothetical protein